MYKNIHYKPCNSGVMMCNDSGHPKPRYNLGQPESLHLLCCHLLFGMTFGYRLSVLGKVGGVIHSRPFPHRSS